MTQPLTVIFDTNVLWTDRKSSSPQWREMRNVHNHYACAVKIPPVVIHELIGLRQHEIAKRQTDIEDAARRVERALKELNSNLSPIGCVQIPPFDVRPFLNDLGHKQLEWPADNVMFDSQRSALDEFVGTTVQPMAWPSISHEEVVRRCSQLKAPFTQEQGKDKGYKDYLIWLCVVDELRVADGIVVMVTNDSAFYGNGESLHPDLQEELIGLGATAGQLVLCRDLSAFNEQFVTPFTSRDFAYEQALRKERYISLAQQIELYGADFDETLDDKINQYAGIAPVLGPNTSRSTTSYLPTLIEVIEARRNPGDSHFLLARVVCRYRIEEKRQALIDGMFTMAETSTHWLALECPSELYVSDNGYLEAASLKADSIVLSDLADCRLTVTTDVKGPCLEVYATMELAEPQSSIQHWESHSVIERCLKEFGVGQFFWRQTVDTEEKKVYEIAKVPTSLLKKWGYAVPAKTW